MGITLDSYAVLYSVYLVPKAASTCYLQIAVYPCGCFTSLKCVVIGVLTNLHPFPGPPTANRPRSIQILTAAKGSVHSALCCGARHSSKANHKESEGHDTSTVAAGFSFWPTPYNPLLCPKSSPLSHGTLTEPIMMRAARLVQEGAPDRSITTRKKVVHTPGRTGVQCTAKTVVEVPDLYIALQDMSTSLDTDIQQPMGLPTTTSGLKPWLFRAL